MFINLVKLNINNIPEWFANTVLLAAQKVSELPDAKENDFLAEDPAAISENPIAETSDAPVNEVPDTPNAVGQD